MFSIEPAQDSSCLDKGPIAGGEFVIAGGYTSVLFEAVDQAFGLVAVPVGDHIEGGGCRRLGVGAMRAWAPAQAIWGRNASES